MARYYLLDTWKKIWYHKIVMITIIEQRKG